MDKYSTSEILSSKSVIFISLAASIFSGAISLTVSINSLTTAIVSCSPAVLEAFSCSFSFSRLSLSLKVIKITKIMCEWHCHGRFPAKHTQGSCIHTGQIWTILCLGYLHSLIYLDYFNMCVNGPYISSLSPIMYNPFDFCYNII